MFFILIVLWVLYKDINKDDLKVLFSAFYLEFSIVDLIFCLLAVISSYWCINASKKLWRRLKFKSTPKSDF